LTTLAVLDERALPSTTPACEAMTRLHTGSTWSRDEPPPEENVPPDPARAHRNRGGRSRAGRTAGYKFDQVNGSNGSIKFTRIPVDVVASYVYGGHRVGAGATAHLAPKFSCEAEGFCNDSVSYGTALGAIAQYAYGFRVAGSGGLELGARYTRVKYKGSGLETLDGSGFGLIFGGWL
jgi:hypothetical protein